MHGQWTGDIEKANGFITAEIDKYRDHYAGHISFFPNVGDIVLVIPFKTNGKTDKETTISSLLFWHRMKGQWVTRDEILSDNSELKIPQNITLNFSLVRKGLKIGFCDEEAQFNIDVFLPNNKSENRSSAPVDRKVTNWKKFKEMVTDLPKDKFIFRGQPVQNRLRTSFHRTNRKDLHKYVTHDIFQLHQALSQNTKHLFDLSNAEQNAAFYALLQHHGYPTPMLDWTYSPYIAAYFAYRNKQPEAKVSAKVRIYLLDSEKWRQDYQQVSTILNFRPHFSLIYPLALENPRSIPQQALSSISTVDDIESYLKMMGEKQGSRYLTAIDLPYSQREVVLDELLLMGISAASLFPGIDGSCETMRRRNFIE